MKTYRRTSAIKTGSILLVLLLFVTLILLPLLGLFTDLPVTDAAQTDILRARLFDASLQAAFLRTMAIALLAIALASIIALPGALLLPRDRPWLHAMLLLLGMLPLAMPPMLTAAILRDLDPTGLEAVLRWLTTSGGLDAADLQLIVVYAVHYLPLLLLTVAAGLRDAPPDATDAARTVGAGRWVIWRRLLLPMALPGYLLGGTLMLLRTLEDAATPLILGIDGMLAPRVLQGLLERGVGEPGPLLDAAVLTATTGVIVLLAWQVLQRPLPVGGMPRPAPATRRASAAALAIGLPVTGIVLAIALLPYAGLALIAIEATDMVHGAALDVSVSGLSAAATAKTLVFALFAGLLLMPAGALLGILIASPGWAARGLRGSVTAVLALPSIVLAFAFVHWIRADADNALPVNAAWVILSLVVALKLLPLGQYLIAARWRSLVPGLSATTQSLGGGDTPRFGTGAFAALLPLVLLSFVLATVGTLTEINTALVLLNPPDAALVMQLYESIRGGSAWQMPALLLGLCVLGMLALVAVLWHVVGDRRRTARGRYREGLNPS